MRIDDTIWGRMSQAERRSLLQEKRTDKAMGWNDYTNGAMTTEYAKFTDGTVLCSRHFNDKYPNAWNTMTVNRKAWGDLFNFELVKYDGTETTEHCTKCREALVIPNNTEVENWTQAWAKVGQLVGMTIAIWIIKGGSTGRAGLDGYVSNKPYRTFNLFETQAAFERELRHQCYMILGHYHIKISEDNTKRWVRELIASTYAIFNAAQEKG